MPLAPTDKIRACNVGFAYGDTRVFSDLNLTLPADRITAIVGPSGRGKSTLLTLFNRLWEGIPGACMQGRVTMRLDGERCDIYAPDCDLPALRRKVGMVFQIPNPLPMSIRKNVAFGLKLSGETNKGNIEAAVERALRNAFLWDEVKDRLNRDARGLSGGQQQRLCVARALVVQPEILLLDEPTSSLDEAATKKIEGLILSLKTSCTVVMVSHDTAQVERVADGWMELG